MTGFIISVVILLRDARKHTAVQAEMPLAVIVSSDVRYRLNVRQNGYCIIDFLTRCPYDDTLSNVEC